MQNVHNFKPLSWILDFSLCKYATLGFTLLLIFLEFFHSSRCYLVHLTYLVGEPGFKESPNGTSHTKEGQTSLLGHILKGRGGTQGE